MRQILRSVLLVAAGGGVLAPAGMALPRQTLRIQGAKQIAVGSSASLRISGHARGHRGLAIYLDNARCARGVIAEAHGVSKRLVVKPVAGRFRHTITFLRSSSGSHYICAYLYHSNAGALVTDRRAAFRYVTR